MVVSPGDCWWYGDGGCYGWWGGSMAIRDGDWRVEVGGGIVCPEPAGGKAEQTRRSEQERQ